jgi:hypothetical protein
VESPLQVTEDGYREAGRRIAALAPVVFVRKVATTWPRSAGWSWPRWTQPPAAHPAELGVSHSLV